MPTFNGLLRKLIETFTVLNLKKSKGKKILSRYQNLQTIDIEEV